MLFRDTHRLALVSALTLASTLTIHADEASKREKIHEMFRLSHVDQTMTQAMAQQAEQVPRFLHSMFPEAKISPEQQKDVDAFQVRVMAMVRESASWQKLEPGFTDIYASTYSEQEIDGLIAFYKSPVGQDMVNKQPEILTKSQAVTQSMMTDLQPKLREAVTQFAQDMQKKYPNGPASTPK